MSEHRSREGGREGGRERGREEKREEKREGKREGRIVDRTWFAEAHHFLVEAVDDDGRGLHLAVGMEAHGRVHHHRLQHVGGLRGMGGEEGGRGGGRAGGREGGREGGRMNKSDRGIRT